MENPAGDINWSFRTFLRVKPPVHAHSPGDPVSDPVSDPVGEGVDGSAQLNYEVSAAEDEEGCAVWRIELEVPLSAEPGLIHNNTTGFVPFCFNNVFGPTADQADVFNSVRDMIVDAFRGINCTVLAYGQTGTGESGCRADVSIALMLSRWQAKRSRFQEATRTRLEGSFHVASS